MEDTLKKVYLAGPMSGMSYEQANNWRKYAEDALRDVGIGALSPLRYKDALSNVDALAKFIPESDDKLLTNAGILTRDYNDVSTSDALLINFEGATEASIGTVAEIAWAWILRKPIVIIMDDNNIHKHGFITQMAPLIAEDLDEGIDLIIRLIGE